MRTLLIIPLATILLITGLLASMLAGQAYNGYLRGQIARQDLDRLRMLLSAEVRLGVERVATNAALAADWPLPPAVATQLTRARHASDQMLASARDMFQAKDDPAAGEIAAIQHALALARAAEDDLLAREQTQRDFVAQRTAGNQMFGVVPLFAEPVLQIVVHTTATDPELAGYLNVARLAINLREYAGRIAAVFIPRIAIRRPFDGEALAQVRTQQGRVGELDRLLSDELRIAGVGPNAQRLAEDMARIYRETITPMLDQELNSGGLDGHYAVATPDFTLTYLTWSNAIVAVWEEVLREAGARVTEAQAARWNRLFWATGGAVCVVLAVLVALISLHRRVVVPVTRLGADMLRLASGERADDLSAINGPPEIVALAKAVDALRRSALLTGQHENGEQIAARQRATLLREAAAAAEAVREPSQQISTITARLAERLERARTSVAAMGVDRSPALDTAVTAVRDGAATILRLADMAEQAMSALRAVDLDGHIGSAADFSRRLGAVRETVEQRDTAVKGFSQPVLAALTSLSEAAGKADKPLADPIHALVADPFQDIQDAVAAIARMRSAIARAGDAVCKATAEETKAAA